MFLKLLEFFNHQYFFVKSSIVISSLLITLLLSEDSEVDESEIEVVLQKTESMI